MRLARPMFRPTTVEVEPPAGADVAVGRLRRNGGRCRVRSGGPRTGCRSIAARFSTASRAASSASDATVSSSPCSGKIASRPSPVNFQDLAAARLDGRDEAVEEGVEQAHLGEGIDVGGGGRVLRGARQPHRPASDPADDRDRHRGGAGRTRRAASAVSNTTPCRAPMRNGSRPRCCPSSSGRPASKLTSNPEGRATMGISSSGAAALHDGVVPSRALPPRARLFAHHGQPAMAARSPRCPAVPGSTTTPGPGRSRPPRSASRA